MTTPNDDRASEFYQRLDALLGEYGADDAAAMRENPAATSARA
ncbi:MAG: hypothetical protein ACJ796_08935 [Gemmatimonadaceae bacterium]